MRFNIKKYLVGHPFGQDMKNNVLSVKKMSKDLIKIANDDLEKSNNIVLICMGSSGAIVATIFYNTLQRKYKDKTISICHIKKENEESHGDRISGFITQVDTLYIWVDDFIISGETLEMCFNVINSKLETLKNTFYVINRKLHHFKYDYVICSTIKPQCNILSIEKMSNNLIYNYL